MRYSKEIHAARAFAALALLSLCSVACEDLRGQATRQAPDDESAAIDGVVKIALDEMQKHYGDGKGLVRRDAHAKAHGCVKAVFQVDPNLSPDLAVGTFSSPGKEYKAWVRFSNGAFSPGPDTGLDGRGMALKILDASPDAPAAPGQVSQHDILMINHPVFFSPDPVDYHDFAKAGALTGDLNGMRRYFIPGWNPLRWRLRQGWIAYRIASTEISSPLSATYFSMSPFSLGGAHAIKYSSRPCAGSPAQRLEEEKTTHPDYLRHALEEGLKAGPACMELLAQVGTGAMPVEDATVEWEQSEAEFRRLGTITIPVQTFTDEGRTSFCEHTSFNSWRAPDELKPLGGMNRMRDAVYNAISRYRNERNAQDIPDPNLAWDAR